MNTKVFFLNLQSLVLFMRAKNRTAIFIECQKILKVESKANERIRKIKSFSDTRWSSNDRVIRVIHDEFEALKNSLELLSKSTDRITVSNAKSSRSI